MTIETEIYGQLSTFSGLTALVSTRIYQKRLPQNVAYPAVTWEKSGHQEISAMSVDASVKRSFWQFHAWAEAPDDGSFDADDRVSEVAKQIRLALQRWRTTTGTIVTDSFITGEFDTDDVDEDTGEITPRRTVTVEIIFEE